MSLTITPHRTSLFRLHQNLFSFITSSLGGELFREGDILAVTSKIVSLSQGRTVSKSSIEKATLVKSEADVYWGEVAYGCSLTIKEGLFIPSAGIDESNSENGDYILYPKNPFMVAEKLREELTRHYQLKNLGILFTDSHTTPLRQGVTGIGLAYAGFRAVKNKVGSTDLFGRKLQMTQMNLLDGLAAAAVLVMGEGDEQTPLALIRGAAVEFCDRVDPSEVQISREKDLYAPFYQRNAGG